MKKLLFWSAVSILFLFSCNDSLEESVFTPGENASMTRAIVSEVSPMLNWDDTTHVSLFNVPGNVVLPWYSTATTGIPSFILDSYKESDGWKLVYNTCSPSGMVQDDKYYLIFYNIFSGKLRGYVYNKNDVTSGDMTFWQLTFNNETTLLNDLAPNTTPGTVPTDEREMLVSNLSVNPTKALSRGWNAFEADFLTYDPNMGNKNIGMTISAYDVNRSQIKLTGNINLESSGTMLTTTTINSLSVPNILTKEVSLLGEAAKTEFEEMFEDKEEPETRSLLSGTVAEIVMAGGNFLVNKFFGRPTTQTIKSDSEIKISTNGKIEANGIITSQQQSNISPLSRLMLPGSNPTPEDIFLPSYDEPLGVWYLADAPVVKHAAWSNFYPISMRPENGMFTGLYGIRDRYGLDESSINVVLNPAITPFIEKYEVSSQLLEIRKIGHVPSRTAQVPIIVDGVGRGGVTYYPLWFDSEYYSAEDSILTRTANSNVFITNNPISPYGFTIPIETYGSIINKKTQSVFKTLNGAVVRVSVTLYPKEPYNTDPIVTTRTFVPTFVEG